MIQCNENEGIVDRALASRGVNANSSNANFGLGAVNSEDGMTNADSGNNMFNSDGDENNYGLAVRPVDSINCGYVIIDCIRDNIETNYCPLIIKLFRNTILILFKETII